MARKGTRAAAADRHALYEQAVQCVDADLDFAERVYRRRYRRRPTTLREDFCGTALASAAFVARASENRAWAVDLDPEVLGYAREHRRASLDEPERLALLQEDVRTVSTPQVDLLLALNFSYYCFKTRAELGGYFRSARQALGDAGLLVLDAYGGWESFEPMEEERKLKGFTYVWDQHSVDAITNEVTNFIHFRFPDGSELPRAFRYDWRLWTLPEIRELLAEAGFSRSEVYWEGWDDENECGNGKFKIVEHAENCAGWIAYVVGVA